MKIYVIYYSAGSLHAQPCPSLVSASAYRRACCPGNSEIAVQLDPDFLDAQLDSLQGSHDPTESQDFPSKSLEASLEPERTLEREAAAIGGEQGELACSCVRTPSYRVALY